MEEYYDLIKSQLFLKGRTSIYTLSIGSLFLFLLGACENDLAEVNQIIGEGASGIEVAREVDMLYSDSAVVRVRVQGPVLKRYLDRNRVREEFSEGVYLEFFDEEGNITSTLKAGYGLRIPLKNRIIVKDEVVFESTEQQKLETSELIWDQNKGEIYTSKFVKISNPEEIIWGYGLKANEDFSRYEIQSLSGRIDAEGFEEAVNVKD